MSNKRDQIIETTCQLIEIQGYHATGLNQILAESGAPKGSLYYYFPEGKEELAIAAIERTSRGIEGNIQQVMTAVPDPIGAINQFILGLAEVVEASGFRAGGPITAVAVEAASTNERLRLACRDAYRRWQDTFAARLRAGGYSDNRAESLSTLIIAALEGAIILSRSQQDARPLRQVAAEIDALLQTGA
ncbi:MAG: TetR/AcrR family transcriptional regulator [Anaerolineae bacterium]|nr:TetR/AcrR family transcriptional regulator [Anaerolineae bacterium]